MAVAGTNVKRVIYAYGVEPITNTAGKPARFTVFYFHGFSIFTVFYFHGLSILTIGNYCVQQQITKIGKWGETSEER